MWPGEGEGVTWVGENLAREAVVKREDLSNVSSETDDWNHLEWSGSEDRESAKQEAKLKREIEEDVYTQTERLFAESSGDESDSHITELEKEMAGLNVAGMPEANTGKGKAPEQLSSPWTPPTAPPRRSMPWSQKPVPKGSYKLEAAPPRPTPRGGSFRPEPSTPRGTRQKWVDDSEIMQHLVGTANLAIPMSQDDGGRWRIHKKQ